MMAGSRPGKRVSISAQRDVFCISTPTRSERTSPAGASKGIGAAIAQALSAEGASVLPVTQKGVNLGASRWA